MNGRDDQVAQALAWGFLAAEWDEPGLRVAGRRTLGRRPRWLPPLVRATLLAYRDPPRDRPGELAAFLAGSEALAGALGPTRTGHPTGPEVRIREVATVAGTMGRRRWPVPEVADLAELSRLLEVPLEYLPWMADLKGLQRRAPEGPLHLYRYRWVPRSSGVPRLLEAPTPLLRATLRRLLSAVLVRVPVHPAAHGFVRGRSALTHARQHLGAPAVVSLDLKDFFAAVTAARVRGIFRALGYPEAVADSLTGLVTHRTPVRVLAAMPAGGDPDGRHRLRARLRTAHLPQGAPTSPALANLVCHTLDCRLAGYADALGLTYTRYADDLTFSGPVERSGPALVEAVGRIVTAEGFALNPAKTRTRSAAERQRVTGIVVNAHGGVSRQHEDRLRAVLHDAVRHGPEQANRTGHPHFRAHLDGRISWVEAVNPVRGRRLRKQLDAVRWPGSEQPS